MTILYIALAGALGSVARYLVAAGVQRLAAPHTQVPAGTLAVNVIGAFVIGVVMAVFAARGELDSRVRIAISVGFLGGFTTYSAFAYETIALLERDRDRRDAGAEPAEVGAERPGLVVHDHDARRAGALCIRDFG